MAHQWIEHPDQSNRKTDFIFEIDGKRAAIIWFCGGFVERPDHWHLKWAAWTGHHDSSDFGSKEEAMQWVESEMGVAQSSDLPKPNT
jgi:hypothetical protein